MLSSAWHTHKPCEVLEEHYKRKQAGVGCLNISNCLTNTVTTMSILAVFVRGSFKS